MNVKNFFKVSAIVAVCAVAYINHGMKQDAIADDATAKTWICNGEGKEIKFRVTNNNLVINDHYNDALQYVKNSGVINNGYYEYANENSRDKVKAAFWQFNKSENFKPSNTFGTKYTCKMVENEEVAR